MSYRIKENLYSDQPGKYCLLYYHILCHIHFILFNVNFNTFDNINIIQTIYFYFYWGCIVDFIVFLCKFNFVQRPWCHFSQKKQAHTSNVLSVQWSNVHNFLSNILIFRLYIQPLISGFTLLSLAFRWPGRVNATGHKTQSVRLLMYAMSRPLTV